MAILPASGVGPGAATTPKVGPRDSFSKVLKQDTTPKAAPATTTPALETSQRISVAKPGQTHAAAHASTAQSTAKVDATHMLDRVTDAQRRMEEVLQLAQSGKSFSPAELLSLQTHVYRASQELDLAGKVVEKATGGVKQILQTQV